MFLLFFFFNDTATTEIYTLSLHDALPICATAPSHGIGVAPDRKTLWVTSIPNNAVYVYSLADLSLVGQVALPDTDAVRDRKSTRLNSSHANISYAVFCLKNKNG